VAALHEARRVHEEEGEQQRLDVAAVDVGVGHDDDLAVAQPAHVDVLAQGMRVDPDGGGDGLQLLVGEHRAAVLRHGVQHLAAQRQDGLAFLVARFLGRAARGVALDQK
jgi:hypothetical protein